MFNKYFSNMFLQNKTQIFLLHFAGGSLYSYEFLKSELIDDFEYYPLELPGRGKRNDEELLYCKKDTVQDYFDQIKSLRNNEPYIIYGHSMGATLGLSVAKKMEEIGDAPEALIVSGNPGPGIDTSVEKRFLMDDFHFKKELKRLGGIPDEVLENDDLYDFFVPIMRADFEVLEKDDFSEKGLKINVPIIALMGDKEENIDQIENWNHFTTHDFSYRILPGNHFFIYNASNELIEILKKSCNHLHLISNRV